MTNTLFNQHNLKLFSWDNLILGDKYYFFRNNHSEVMQVTKILFNILLTIKDIHPSSYIEYELNDDDDSEIYQDLGFKLDGMLLSYNVYLKQPNKEPILLIENYKVEEFISDSFMEIDDSLVNLEELNVYSKWI